MFTLGEDLELPSGEQSQAHHSQLALRDASSKSFSGCDASSMTIRHANVEGLTDTHPIVIPDISVQEFEDFLTFLYQCV